MQLSTHFSIAEGHTARSPKSAPLRGEQRPVEAHAKAEGVVFSPLTRQDLEALLWTSRRPRHESAWHGHVAFAHWLVQAARPRVLVELGTQHGVSYASFCHAVTAVSVGTKCFAIDTWCGDDRTGAYGEDVYGDLKSFNDTYYSAFSRLLRSTFDDALAGFAAGTIDLLHIDGRHTYESVKHDFETWQPKLSERAVVLFHDTVITEEGFGVWRLWDELSQRFPSFNFTHSCGLGVLAVGAEPAPAVAALCSVRDEQEIVRIRYCMERFSTLARANASQQLILDEFRGQVKRLTALCS
jgi:hypothetical protein